MPGLTSTRWTSGPKMPGTSGRGHPTAAAARWIRIVVAFINLDRVERLLLSFVDC